MSKSCECCKRYWTHLHGKVKCFVGKMNRNSRHVMVIPESFVNYSPRKISGAIKLEAPNGSVYDVGITEHQNKTLLRSGWEAFVDANHIVENDLLMFQYRGNSRFKVIVFDSSGCEKVVSCAHIESNISDQEPSTNSTDMSSSSSDHNIQSSACGRSDGGQSGSSGHCRKRARKDAISSPSKDLSGEESPCEHESSESDDDTLSKSYVLSGQCYLTKEQDAEIVALVQEIQPERPPLVAMMKPNMKPYPDLVIPKDYALAHFPHKNQTITLQIPGQTKKWHCQFRVRSDGGRCNLFGCDFAGDNHLLEGDLCLFQPTTRANGRTFKVAVHLLRKASNDHTSRNLVIGSNRGLANSKLASTMRVKEEPDVGEATLYSEHGFSENSLEHDGSESSKLPYMMPMGPRLTKSQEKKVLEKLGTIRSELPIYVAVMKKTNLTGQSFASSLTFGKQYSATYLRKGSRNLVLQRKGKSQTWHAEMRDRDGGGLRIFGGWTSFACDNRLREGDLCLFQLMKHKEQLTMIVDIILREHC